MRFRAAGRGAQRIAAQARWGAKRSKPFHGRPFHGEGGLRALLHACMHYSAGTRCGRARGPTAAEDPCRNLFTSGPGIATAPRKHMAREQSSTQVDTDHVLAISQGRYCSQPWNALAKLGCYGAYELSSPGRASLGVEHRSPIVVVIEVELRR